MQKIEILIVATFEKAYKWTFSWLALDPPYRIHLKFNRGKEYLQKHSTLR